MRASKYTAGDKYESADSANVMRRLGWQASTFILHPIALSHFYTSHNPHRECRITPIHPP